MTGLPASIMPKVAALVRLMSSPHDGEALAAVRGLERTLSAAGCTFHDLADRLGVGALPIPRLRTAPRAPRTKPTWAASRRRDISAKLRAGLHSGAFNSWEAKFAADIADHIEREGCKTFSPKQASTAEALAEKASRWGARC